MTLRSVLFPSPLRPVTHARSPASTLRRTSWSTGGPPKATDTSRRVSSDMAAEFSGNASAPQARFEMVWDTGHPPVAGSAPKM